MFGMNQYKQYMKIAGKQNINSMRENDFLPNLMFFFCSYLTIVVAFVLQIYSLYKLFKTLGFWYNLTSSEI